MHSWFHGFVEFLIPPASLPVIGILASLASFRWRRTGRALAVLAGIGLFLLSLPIVARSLIAPLETGLPLAPSAKKPPRAILVLGGDVIREIGGVVAVGPLTLERLRTAARIERKFHLPILVSGGPLRRGEPPIAELMAKSLARDFGTPATWVETASKDTWQNVHLSAVILERHHIHSVYLVTQPWHIRRSLIAFEGLPFTVAAAPTQLDRPPSWAARNFVPDVFAWRTSYFALHEWIGCVYYELHRW